jgi:hypothetical protein
MMEQPGRRGAAEPGGAMDSEEQLLKAMTDQYLVHTKCRPISTESKEPHPRSAPFALEREKPCHILLLSARKLGKLAQRHSTRCASGSRHGRSS